LPNPRERPPARRKNPDGQSTHCVPCCSADGAPQFAPLEGADLLYLSNTGRDVFQTLGAQQYYVLLSGRWFAAPSLENGPWAYVAPDKLPAGFYRIPPASAKGHVLAFVPDTPKPRKRSPMPRSR